MTSETNSIVLHLDCNLINPLIKRIIIRRRNNIVVISVIIVDIEEAETDIIITHIIYDVKACL